MEAGEGEAEGEAGDRASGPRARPSHRPPATRAKPRRAACLPAGGGRLSAKRQKRGAAVGGLPVSAGDLGERGPRTERALGAGGFGVLGLWFRLGLELMASAGVYLDWVDAWTEIDDLDCG